MCQRPGASSSLSSGGAAFAEGQCVTVPEKVEGRRNPSLSVKGLSFSGPVDTQFSLVPTPHSSDEFTHFLLVFVLVGKRALLLVLSEVASV